MENIEIRQKVWHTLGKFSEELYRDSQNKVILLDNTENHEYVLLFMVLDPRLDNKLPLVAFNSKEEALLFFRVWRTHVLKDIRKAQKQQKISQK